MQCCDLFETECEFIFEPPAEADVIIITEIADPVNNGGGGNIRYVELFNLACVPVSLSSGFALRRFTNANTVPQVGIGLVMVMVMMIVFRRGESAGPIGQAGLELTMVWVLCTATHSLSFHCLEPSCLARPSLWQQTVMTLRPPSDSLQTCALVSSDQPTPTGAYESRFPSKRRKQGRAYTHPPTRET